MTTLHTSYTPERRPERLRISAPKAIGLGIFAAGLGVGVVTGGLGWLAPDYPTAREWFSVATVAITVASLGGAMFLAEFLREIPNTPEPTAPASVCFPCAVCGAETDFRQLEWDEELGEVCPACLPKGAA